MVENILIQANIFGVFERIGLVISKQMIEVLGENRLEVHSDLDVGTRISFYIHDHYAPSELFGNESTSEFAADDIVPNMFFQMDKRVTWETLENKGLLPSCRSIKTEALINTKPVSSNQKCFVMLDDTLLNLQVLKACLGKYFSESHRIEMFTTPEKLLKFLDEENLSDTHYIFFLDIEVSSTLDGFQIARMVRKKFSEINEQNSEANLISYSSHSSDYIKSHSCDFDSFLPKPFDKPVFIKVMQSLNIH